MVMMEDAITNNSKTAPALEKEGMMLCGGGREREGGRGGEEKRKTKLGILFALHTIYFYEMGYDFTVGLCRCTIACGFLLYFCECVIENCNLSRF